MKDPRIVAHLVAGYPSVDASKEVARGLIDGGAFALEIQIPFSDPTADGPAIEEACRVALERGCSVKEALGVVREIRRESDVPIFLMSYANLVVAPGIDRFVRSARDAGATGLIVPDLSPGSDDGLYLAADDARCRAVPVVVPWITKERRSEVLDAPIDWVYVALRRGITGTYTDLGPEQEVFLSSLRTPGVSVMAGFGIQRAQQVAALVPHADAAVVGSEIVRAVANAPAGGEGEAARRIVESLRGL